MLFLAQPSRPLPACFIPVTVDREKSCVTLCTAIASARQKRACRSRLCLTPSSLCPFAMRYLDVTAPGILLEKALALQDLVHRSMPDQSMFWPDTLDFFADTLAKGGTLVLAVGDQIDTLSARVDAEYVTLKSSEGQQGLVAGYFLLRLPNAQDADNLGRDANLAAGDLSLVAHLESVAVHPAFRGRGLARIMAKRLVEKARAAGKKHLFATVAPDNTASLAMLASLGLTVYHTRPKYAGLVRHIMYTTL